MKNEIDMASDHISTVMSRGEDAKADAEELVRATEEKLEAVTNLVTKCDEAMEYLKELQQLIEEVTYEYDDLDLD